MVYEYLYPLERQSWGSLVSKRNKLRRNTFYSSNIIKYSSNIRNMNGIETTEFAYKHEVVVSQEKSIPFFFLWNYQLSISAEIKKGSERI